MKSFKNLFRIFLFLSFLIPGILYPQALYFCESVDEYGEPVSSSDYFIISSDGGYLDILVKMDNEVGVNSVCYKIYKIKNGKEIYDNSIWQNVEPEWTWFWKEIIFYETGMFNIYIYDEDGNILTSGTIEISYR